MLAISRALFRGCMASRRSPQFGRKTVNSMDDQKQGTLAAPKVIVRRKSKRLAVTPVMKERLRKEAKTSARTRFPELPEWQR